MNELMERLARANPAPPGDALTPEEQREADALLERILAEPDAATPVRRTRPPLLRRLVPAAAVLAVVALAVLVVADLLSSEERDGGIVERAAAAVSQEDVIYAITERHTISSRALEPGARLFPEERGFVRLYLWRSGERSRFLDYGLRADGGPGRLRAEMVVDDEATRLFDPVSNTIDVLMRGGQSVPVAPTEDDGYPGFSPSSDPGAQVRAHVEQGRLQVAGKTTVRGRTAYRLTSRPRSVPKQGIEREMVTYLVDARTFLPFEVRQRTVSTIDGRQLMKARIEYLRYDPLPITEENRQLLEMAPHPGAQVIGGQRP
jgi:hypothetical protein